ncbi:MAG: serine hydrolase [Calditrichaeota bacterium]|nr:MAG: serine hydrolase [Calditrichota bacterium]
MLSKYLKGLSDSLHAEISVSFYDLQTGQAYGFADRKMMHAASTMKVPVMIEVFRQAEAGRFSLHDSLLVKNQFRSIVDGSPFSLDPAEDGEQSLYQVIGQKRPIRELVEQMITWSSNLATNLLIEWVGAKNVMATLREIGAKDMQVLRGVEDLKAYRQGLNNRTNAHDLMVVMRALAQKTVASPAACKQMIDILKHQHWRTKIPGGLPPGVAVANKTGSITAIDHDCAIVFPPQRKPYVLVVLTRGIADHDQAAATIAAISHKIYAMLQPQKSS